MITTYNSANLNSNQGPVEMSIVYPYYTKILVVPIERRVEMESGIAVVNNDLRWLVIKHGEEVYGIVDGDELIVSSVERKFTQDGKRYAIVNMDAVQAIIR